MMPDPHQDPPRVLAGMLDTSDTLRWSDADVAAMLRHQLALAPAAELARAGVADEATLAACGSWPTLRAALLDGQPDPRVLEAIKRYAKDARGATPGAGAEEVLRVVYFAAIAAAGRRGVAITALSPAALADACAWCRSLPWLDPGLRALFSSSNS